MMANDYQQLIILRIENDLGNLPGAVIDTDFSKNDVRVGDKLVDETGQVYEILYRSLYHDYMTGMIALDNKFVNQELFVVRENGHG
ncbi:MAG TPA: hypothetical protein VGM95_02415 [Lactobacillaceae bacterium]|jgi:hypothetical protein